MCSIKKNFTGKLYILPLLLVLLFSLSACGSNEKKGIQTYEGTNGVTVTYDANLWEEPYMVQDDTISLVTGTSFNYTAVLFQVTDSYEDFLNQSKEEMMAETTCIEYPYELEVEGAETSSIRLDCGSYQTVFSVIDFGEGHMVYMTCATYSGDLTKVEELCRTITY